jgi:hypothetical protein
MRSIIHMIGIGRAAKGAIAGELRLVHLDQVFGSAARSVTRRINMLGRALGDRCENVADVHAQRADLDPGVDATLACPALPTRSGFQHSYTAQGNV